MIKCTFENGNETSLRHVTVGAIAIDKNNQVLVIKRASNLLRGNKYAIPGGFLDRDENAREATLRELFEETGLKGEISLLFRVNDSPDRPKEDRQNVDFIYIVKIVGGEIKISAETASVNWFSLENLPSEEEFAFDHRDSIIRYFEYLKKEFELPIIG
ncbi:MAG: NUDIX hydrolase [Candidatus Levybacteria bacterium]|nr:NUDIX hydrolase [Candidatus Levybacteria bacterium]